MNSILKRVFMPGVLATGLVGSTFLAIKPAAADEYVYRDAAIGAATGVVSSVITGHKVVPNIVNGAAAGVAVNQSRDVFRTRKSNRGLSFARDAAVGAGASAAVGALTNRRHAVRNAANGAAVGAVINVVTQSKQRHHNRYRDYDRYRY